MDHEVHGDFNLQLAIFFDNLFKTISFPLCFHSASLCPEVELGTGKLNAGDNPAVD